MIEDKREVWTKWGGTFRGVSYEIMRGDMPWRREDKKEAWCFYLYIVLNRIPNTEYADSLWLPGTQNEKGRVSYKYSDSAIANLDWHCGCTFYQKMGGHDGESRIVKAGCDYGHYWDEGRSYDLDFVEFEAIECAESFLARVPDYKRHCHMVGGYWLPSEGVTSKDGKSFISFKGIEYAEKDITFNPTRCWWSIEKASEGVEA